jgi:hypothetical protein
MKFATVALAAAPGGDAPLDSVQRLGLLSALLHAAAGWQIIEATKSTGSPRPRSTAWQGWCAARCESLKDLILESDAFGVIFL